MSAPLSLVLELVLVGETTHKQQLLLVLAVTIGMAAAYVKL